MKIEDIDRKRILEGVKGWFRRRGISGSEDKRFEVAALVAESEANGLAALFPVAKKYADRVSRLRKLAEDFRRDSNAARLKARAL